MSKLKASLLALSLAFVISCNKQGQVGKDVKITSEEDKTFYSIGVLFGQRLKEIELKDNELNPLIMGLMDSARGKDLAVDISKYQKSIQDLFKERISKNSQKSKDEGKNFLDTFVKKEGATKTDSGLAYKIIKNGEGKSPKPEDIVEVHYKGTLIDGTQFDSSYDRKNKVSFPLNRVIKGWTEGLQLLKEGGEIKMVIPSELAYGDQGAPPKIPGGATLVFNVELFSVKDASTAGADHDHGGEADHDHGAE
jgi:FKBP-type peptidyl-prolyl cis-trans isomerase FkpA